MTPDSIFLFGVTLLVSVAGAYLLPDFFVDRSGTSATRLLSLSRPFLTIACVFFLSVGLVFALHQVNQRILHSFLSSADEHSCYFLAECLRRGKLFVSPHPLSAFFDVVHVGNKAGKWYSVYPLGWPLIWSLGLRFQIVDWLNPVMSSLAVVFFYFSGQKLFSRSAAFLGLIFMCSSPFFMFTAASYFSHGTCLLCISVFLYGYLRWREAASERSAMFWAGVAAFSCGYGLMTRYLTMATVACPFLLYHFAPLFLKWSRREQRAMGDSSLSMPGISLKRPLLRRSDIFFLVIVALFFLSIFAHNYAVTGNVFKPPVKFYQSWERLGFKRGQYTPVDGFFFLIARVFYLMDWFAPAVVGLYLFLTYGWVKKIKDSPLTWIFRFCMVFLAGAYFLYYSWGGNQWGPRYLWEGMPFLCIATADWILGQWRTGNFFKRKFWLVFVTASILTSGVLFAKQAEFTEEASRQRRALYDLADITIQKPAIVFVRGLLGKRLLLAEGDAVRNSPFLDGKILYAHDLGDRNIELMHAYPTREYYLGFYDSNLATPRLEKLS